MIEPKQLTHSGSWKISLTAGMLWATVSVHAQTTEPDSITGRVHDIPNVTIEARRAPNRVSSNAPIQTLNRATIEDLGRTPFCRYGSEGLWRHWRNEDCLGT